MDSAIDPAADGNMSDAALRVAAQSINDAQEALSNVANAGESLSKNIQEYISRGQDEKETFSLPHTKAEAESLLAKENE